MGGRSKVEMSKKLSVELMRFEDFFFKLVFYLFFIF